MSLITKLDNATHEEREMLTAKIAFMRAWIRNGFKRKVILFYPERPRVWHLLYSICHILGYSISNDPKRHYDAIVAFWDITTQPNEPILQELIAQHRVINAHCNDISKTHVEKIFHEIFGYGMAIDPRTHQGAYVKKSETNGLHNGTILHEPREPQEGYIYQRLVNNIEGDQARDIQVFICKDAIPFVRYRYKKTTDRFDHTLSAEFVDTNDVLTKEEQEVIIRFCKKCGLDFGELDVLRDKDDGKIYIVDVSNTPSQPTMGQLKFESRSEWDARINVLAHLFEKKFLKGI